jgi:hypothetical protein
MQRREEATTLGRYDEQHPNTAQNLLEAAWRHCGAIQDIIDRLNEVDTRRRTCWRTGCTA